jgi:hypothetical protein
MLGASKAGLLGAAGGGFNDPLFADVEFLMNGDIGYVDVGAGSFSMVNAGTTNTSGRFTFTSGSVKQITMSPSIALPDPFTFEAVFQNSGYSAQTNDLIYVGDGNNNNILTMLTNTIYGPNTNDYQFRQGANFVYRGPPAPDTTTIHLLGVVRQGTSIQVYLDGVAFGAPFTSGSGTLASYPFILGNRTNSSDFQFLGDLYSCRLTYAARTPAEMGLVDEKYFPVPAMTTQSGVEFSASSGYTVSTTVATNDTTLRVAPGASWNLASLLDVPLTSGKYVASFKALALASTNRAEFGVSDAAATTSYLSALSLGEGGINTQSPVTATYAINQIITVFFDATTKTVRVLQDGYPIKTAYSVTVTGAGPFYFAFQEYDINAQVQLVDNGVNYPGFTKLVP